MSYDDYYKTEAFRLEQNRRLEIERVAAVEQANQLHALNQQRYIYSPDYTSYTDGYNAQNTYDDPYRYDSSYSNSDDDLRISAEHERVQQELLERERINTEFQNHQSAT